jgi:hypothetical protein
MLFVSAISFDQLEDEVTKRWLSEPCPGKRLSSVMRIEIR